MLERHLEVTRVAYGLSRNEGEKLRLAASGDVTRYLGRIREMRHRDGATAGNPIPRLGLEDVVLLQREFQRGPFGDGSLFAKVLAKIQADREAAGGAKP